MSEPASFEVSTESLRALSSSVGEASVVLAGLRAGPASLAAGLTGAGSPALVAAADAFTEAWERGRAALERDTALLADALRRAGDAYELDEATAVAAMRGWRAVGGPLVGLEGL